MVIIYYITVLFFYFTSKIFFHLCVPTVDLAVRLLNKAAAVDTEEAASELQDLVASAQARIQEIEEFYTENDDGMHIYIAWIYIYENCMYDYN